MVSLLAFHQRAVTNSAWVSMGLHGYSCISTDIHGYPWAAMDERLIGISNEDALSSIREGYSTNVSCFAKYYALVNEPRKPGFAVYGGLGFCGPGLKPRTLGFWG